MTRSAPGATRTPVMVRPTTWREQVAANGFYFRELRHGFDILFGARGEGYNSER